MSFEPVAVEKYIENWRADLYRESERLGIDKNTADLLIATTEPCVRTQINWLKQTIEYATVKTLEMTDPVDLRGFYDTMLGKPYVAPVYSIEAIALPGSVFWSTGRMLREDSANTVDELLDKAYEAFNQGISHVFITHAGERLRFDTPVALFCHFKPE